EAGVAQGGGDGFGVADHVLVGDDEGAAAGRSLAGKRAEAGTVVAGDDDVVAAVAELDADGGHVPLLYCGRAPGRTAGVKPAARPGGPQREPSRRSSYGWAA